MMNHRLTLAAAIAVLAASLSLSSLLIGTSWLVASVGAVAAVALAATLTRLSTVQAAIAGSIVVLLGAVPVLVGYGWAGIAGAAVMLGLTAASATGARLLRVFAATATYVIVPFLYLNAVFAGRQSWAAVIPTSRSLAVLARLPGDAGSMFKYSPPIPTSRAVEFITVGGVTVIAICVDVLAVRLRRPALAGLPLLLLFSVPVASSLKSFGFVQTLLFGLAVAAYLGLLSSDGRQRLRMWGRLVTIRRPHAMDDSGQGPDTRQVAASGRRVGLTAVALAMVVPIFLAGTPPKDLFAKTPTGGLGGGLAIPGGLAPLSSVGQLLLQKPTLVLTYTTTDSNPQDQYLQEYVLNYDYGQDGKWLPSASSGKPVSGTKLPFQQVPGLTDEVPVVMARTAVSLNETAQTPLPLPYAPVQVDAPGSSLVETSGTFMVFGNNQPVRSPRYSVVSKEADPSSADLEIPGSYPQSVQKVYTSYRGPDRSQLLRIARAHTQGASTPLDKAVALQHWFTSSAFTYTLTEKWPASGSWLVKFLTTDKRGDCEQFAPAFAVLARLLGIPSRVAVGYTAGTAEPRNTWRVTTADAHAWPELYFPGAGWVRFEPTPAGSEGVAGQGTAVAPGYTIGSLPSGNPGSNQPSTSPSAGAAGGVKPTKPIPGKHLQAGGGPAGTAVHTGTGIPVWPFILVAILLLLGGPALARRLGPRRRWLAASGDADRASVAWRELRDYLTDYGIVSAPSESPRAVARRVATQAHLDEAASAAVTRIGAAEERARYAQTAVPAAGLPADVATVRRALAENATRPQRLRAWLLPPSTMASLFSGLQSTGHVLSWLDSPLPNWRRDRARPQQAR
jgi:transglutaminase-like putative cysteine protease